jgi:hypothetical protein
MISLNSNPPDLHRDFRWSPGVACYRSSKLVVALYAVSAAPADLSRLDGDIRARLASH